MPEYARPKRTRPTTSLKWIFDGLADDPTYEDKRMFGFDAAYIDELLCLVVADRGEPWDGLMICTAHEHHASLMAELPVLQPHAVLGKWLYVSQHDPDFEAVTRVITDHVMDRDPRIGVVKRTRVRAGRS